MHHRRGKAAEIPSRLGSALRHRINSGVQLLEIRELSLTRLCQTHDRVRAPPAGIMNDRPFYVNLPRT